MEQGHYPNFSPIPSLSGFIGILDHVRNSFLGALSLSKDNMDHGKKAPVFLLIPGFSGNHGTMKELGENLGEKANVVYAPNFPLFNTVSIREAAKILNEKIVKILSLQGKNIDLRLVGFSNGGLIALDTLRHNASLKVSEVITMGTPFKGTPLVTFLPIRPQSCVDISQKGGYLAGVSLTKQLSRLSIHVAHNDSIVPPQHQIPDGSIAPGKISIIHHTGFHHTDFIRGENGIKLAKILLS